MIGAIAISIGLGVIFICTGIDDLRYVLSGMGWWFIGAGIALVIFAVAGLFRIRKVEHDEAH